MEAPLGSVVAVTKLQVPDRRATLVPRESLIGLLTGGRPARLTLLSGPAGAGKTTLLSQWRGAEGEPRPFAWLSLDPEDADPVRFWRLVIEALRRVHPDFGADAATALRAGSGAVEGAVVPLLVNAAAALPAPMVLVLDDLHALGDDAEVHESLGALLDRLPATLHVAIATRHEPPLPIARWRARGELVELRAGDLRFSDDDAAALLSRGFGLELASSDVSRLQERTEGWAAGLQLAGISLERRGADFEAFMAAFGAGGETDVLAYLGSEMLDAQPPELRAFLQRTSILTQLTEPVCDAVTGAGDAAEHLDELGRRNLLAVPLDPARRIWRYHHLLGELLRHELERTHEPAEIAELHRRAGAWHREHGSANEAIRHALAAGDAEDAAAMIVAEWEPAFNRGELTTVAGWLDSLPAETVAAHPRLWLARLWTAMDRGHLETAARALEDFRGPVAPEVRAWSEVLRALHAFKRGNLAEASALAAGTTQIATGDLFCRTVAAHARGLASYWTGDAARARREFTEAAALAGEDANTLGHAYALGYLALIAVDARDRDGAERQLERVDELRDQDAAVGEHFVVFAATLARGRLLESSGAYEAAGRTLARAVDRAERGAGRLETVEALLALALVERARGDREEAAARVREARGLLDGCPDPGRVAERQASAERAVLGAAAVRAESPGGLRDALSDSELAVLRLLPTELSQREIGTELFISVNTVMTHCRNIYAKLRASSREQAVGRARELGVL